MARTSIHDEASESAPRWEVAALAGVLAVAAALRAVRLIESFWYDEIAAFRYAQAGPWKIITTLHDPANHILHTLLTWVTFHVIPSGLLYDETVLRLPAFVASLVSIVAIYFLVRWALEPRAALLAAMIAALAPVSVLEGAEARGYSMMICFSAAATWQMCRIFAPPAMNPRSSGQSILLYASLAAMGAWAHLLTLFVLIGHALWIGWCAFRKGTRDFVAPALAVLAAALFTLVLYAPVLDDLLRNRRVFERSGEAQPRVLGPEGFHAVLQLGGAWYWWTALPGLLLLVFGLFEVIRRRGTSPRLFHAMMLSLLGLPALILTVWATGSWMYARFALFTLPGGILLMTLGLIWLRQRQRIAGAVALLILLLCFGLDLGIRPPKQPLREAAEFVLLERMEGEGVLVIGIAHRVMDAYLAHVDPVHSLGHGRDLRAQLSATEPEWVIVLYPESVPPSRFELLRSEGFEVVARFRGWVDWDRGDVLVFRREGGRL